jgi:hypothetical protein
VSLKPGSTDTLIGEREMTVIFKDDKKEKYQSHEAIFTATVTGGFYYTDVEIIGYGASKDEAIKNLKIAMDEVSAQMVST